MTFTSSSSSFIRQTLDRLIQFCLVMGLLLCLSQPALAMGGKLPPLDQPAPAFTLPTNTGQGKVSLSDYQGKWLVAYFYPKDFTSGCTLEAQRFQKDLQKYHDRYGSWLGVVSSRHTFIVDPDGLLRSIFLGVNPSVHSREVLAKLAELQG
jgi:peroxiredoxin Q/BCP